MSPRPRNATGPRGRPWGLAAALLLTAAGPGWGAVDAPDDADLQFFDTRIRPVLEERCAKCHSHSADRIRGGLVLDTREGLLHGGNSGPAVVPGKPDESVLIQALRYDDPDLQMPPSEHGGRLPERQLADFVEWVRRGAPDPRTRVVAAAGGKSYGGVGRQHWAFQPVQAPAEPEVADAAWARSPVDRFILARIEAAGLAPCPPADKRTLIRRATFDLTGLPPAEDDIRRFLADDSPEAFARVVDRLLASPHYGERWARFWMDVARYSDTKGDAPRRDDPRFPYAWTYRDYLVDAFNQDKPFDRFIVEQLAADRLVEEEQAAARRAGRAPPADQRVLAALGFLTLGNQHDGRRNDIIDDRIDVTTKAFLGLTVSCARCHDHKFDPIPTQDYYSLYGVFANTVEPRSVFAAPALVTSMPRTAELAEYLGRVEDLKKRGAELQGEFQELRRSRNRDPNRRRELLRREGALQREIGALELTHPGAFPRAHALADVPNPRDYPVLKRGEAQNEGEIAPRRFLAVLSPDPAKRPSWRKGSGRRELAAAIADARNPLTARVLVNRVWLQHFGTGLIATPDDLGNMGGAPSHPELLDWLAARFVADGWSVKRLHRTIMLSSAYQQSSRGSEAAFAVDPDNRLLTHFPLQRLDLEQVYDALLAIAGALDPAIGGRPVLPSSEGFGRRRALYFFIDRRNPPELFTQFDFPNPDVPSGRRHETTVPQQALFLMNSPLVIETARKLTHRPEFVALAGDEQRVGSLYLSILQRPPTAEELRIGIAYVRANPFGTALEVPEPPAMRSNRERLRAQRQAQRAQAQANAAAGRPDARPVGAAVEHGGPLDAWTKYAQALFQTNEAMFLQ